MEKKSEPSVKSVKLDEPSPISNGGEQSHAERADARDEPSYLDKEIDSLSGSRAIDITALHRSDVPLVKSAPSSPMPDEILAKTLVREKVLSTAKKDAAAPAPLLTTTIGTGGSLDHVYERVAVPVDILASHSDAVGLARSSSFSESVASRIFCVIAPDSPSEPVLIRQQEVAPDSHILVLSLHHALTVVESMKRSHVVLRSSTSAFLELTRDEAEMNSVERRQCAEERWRLIDRIAAGPVSVTAHVDACQAVRNAGAEVFISCQHHIIEGDNGQHEAFQLRLDSGRFGILPSFTTMKILCDRIGIRAALAALDSLATLSPAELKRAGLVVPPPTTTSPAQSSRSVGGKRVLEKMLLGLVPNQIARRCVLEHVLLGREDRKLQSPWKDAVIAAALIGDVAESKRRYEDTANQTQSTRTAVVAATAYCFSKKCERLLAADTLKTNSLVFEFSKREQWGTIVVDPSTSPALIFDCSSPERVKAAEEYLAKLVVQLGSSRAASECSFVILGDHDAAKPVTRILECAAVVSAVSPIPLVDGRALQELAVISASGCDQSVKERALVAGMSFLHVERDPFIITSGCVVKQVAAALTAECCRLAQHSSAAAVQEAVTTHLKFNLSPFEVIDTIGTELLLSVLGNPIHPRYDLTPCHALEALKGMQRDGFLGKNSLRGGFGQYEGERLVELNSHVFATYVARKPSHKEIADRVLYSVINELCGLITSGAVSAEDANIASLAVGFPEQSGGALLIADEIGVRELHERMIAASQWIGGSHLAPATLLRQMVNNNETFATLSASTINSALAVRGWNATIPSHQSK